MARRAQYKLTMPVVPEHSIQATMTKVLSVELAPAGKLSKFGVLWFSVDHANYAGEVPGVRIGRGIISGIPDTFVLYRGRTFLLELKSEDGQLTDSQKEVIAAATLCGIRCAVACTQPQILEALDAWEIPRKRLIKFAALAQEREASHV